MEKYDLIIVGAGPAGLTASIYASRYKISNLVIGGLIGGLATESHKMCNFPGYPEIGGFELAYKIKDHAEKSGGKIIMDEVLQVIKLETGFLVKTRNGKELESKTIIFATGSHHRKLGLAREAEFVGKGIAYCATCDAMFYKGKIVGVVGGGNSAVTAALYLSEVAEKVYLFSRDTELMAEPIWLDEVFKKTNLEVVYGVNVVDLLGESRLEVVVLDKEINNSTKLNLAGLFVEIGILPQTELFKELGGELDLKNRMIVNQAQATNILGVWAAGDSTTNSNNFNQVITACSEGAVAADSIFKYLKTQS